MDGIVLLGSCCKIVPGMLIGILRANIPAIMVPGGSMPSGPCFGEKGKADTTTALEAMGQYRQGKRQTVHNLMTITKLTAASVTSMARPTP